MPTPFSSQDLGRVFDARSLTSARRLLLGGAVAVELDGEAIAAVVRDAAGVHTGRITPSPAGRRVAFATRCSCGAAACPHLAAAALAALDRFPALRRAEQQSFLDALVTAPEHERQRLVFDLAPAAPPHACIVTTLLIGERSGGITATTPRRIAEDAQADATARDLAGLLGGGTETRSFVPPSRVAEVLPGLARSGLARWHAGGRRLIAGEERVFAAASAASLPAGSEVIAGETGPWYVDAASGAVGRIRVQAPVMARRPPPEPPPAPPPAGRGRPQPPRRRAVTAAESEQVIVERTPTPVLRLTRFPFPDDAGRMRDLDALVLEFDYGGAVIAADDDRQFLRSDQAGTPVFVRRNRAAEAAALETLRQDGFVQMRMAEGKAAKGRLVFVFRGRDAAESWQRFVAERLPALQAGAWHSLIDPGFGPRPVGAVGAYDMRLADAPHGGFSLDLGLEIDGVRHPLLPVLLRLRERGGIAAARVIDGELVTSLDDGRILKLPAERAARLLAVLDDLIEFGAPPHRRRPGAGCRRGARRARPGGAGHRPLAGRRRHRRPGRALPRPRRHPGRGAAARLHRYFAPLPAAGRQLAAAPARARSRRLPRR